MSQRRFLYLWEESQPERALKIRLTEDEIMISALESWGGPDATYTASMQPPPGQSDATLPLSFYGALYAPDDRHNPGGN